MPKNIFCGSSIFPSPDVSSKKKNIFKKKTHFQKCEKKKKSFEISHNFPGPKKAYGN
jgi:hypothetical protein